VQQKDESIDSLLEVVEQFSISSIHFILFFDYIINNRMDFNIYAKISNVNGKKSEQNGTVCLFERKKLYLLSSTKDFKAFSSTSRFNVFVRTCKSPEDCEIGKKLSKEEALKAFEPSFKVLSKIETLNQLLMKYSERQISITDGEKSSFTSFSKTHYDIFTLNESLPTEEEKEFISKKFYTIITINSQCKTFNKETDDCQLEKVLDLNVNNKGDLGEVDPDIIRQVFVPICFI
jgi:hypothetical protein